MIGSIEEEDAREERRRLREEARATRGNPPAMLTQFDGSTGNHSRPVTPAVMPAQAEPPTSRPAAFELVDELPNSKGRHGRKFPQIRTQAAEFAKAHPGQWVRYNPTPEDPFKSASSVATQVRKGHAGFGPGFEANVRAKSLFIRYVGKQTGATP